MTPEQTCGALRSALAEGRPRDALRCLGRLIAMGEAAAAADARSELMAIAPAPVDLASLARLEDRVAQFPVLLDAIARVRSSRHEALEREILAVLRARTDLEFELVATEHLLGEPPDLSPEARGSVQAMDSVLRTQLHRLVRLNPLRAAELGPYRRLHGVLWWWSGLVDLPPEAGEHLGSVAELCARDRSAAAAFDAQRYAHRRRIERERADEALEPPGEPAAPAELGRVIRLDFRRAPAPSRVHRAAADDTDLRLAGADAPIVHHTPEVRVRAGEHSMSGGSLLALRLTIAPGRTTDDLDVQVRRGGQRLVPERKQCIANVWVGLFAGGGPLELEVPQLDLRLQLFVDHP